jgi:hypothetical protein
LCYLLGLMATSRLLHIDVDVVELGLLAPHPHRQKLAHIDFILLLLKRVIGVLLLEEKALGYEGMAGDEL